MKYQRFSINFHLERVADAASKLKESYKRLGERAEVNIFNNPISDLTVHGAFTDLYIVEGQFVRETWQKVQESDNQQHLNMAYEAQISNRKIDPPEIIDEHKNSAVVAGVAGYGKTFLMEYVCSEWSYDNIWPSFFLVFMLRCRELNITLHGKSSLYEVLCTDYRPILKDIDSTELESLGKNVLVILDGVDELAGIEKIVKGQDLTPSQSVLRKLLMDKNGHCCIVTGRPAATFQVRQLMCKEKPVSSIQTVGFSIDQVKKFMKKYFKSETHEGYQRLRKIIDNNPRIQAMCRVPILLKIMCCLYLREESVAEPKTVTELYIHALVYFIGEHSKKLGHPTTVDEYRLGPEMLRVIRALGQVAYKLLLKGKIMVRVKEIEHVNLDELISSGIVSIIQIAKFKYAVFPHLSFMEILVASHMKIEGLKLEHMKERQLALARGFYCGFEGILAKNSGDCFYNFVESLESVVEKQSTKWFPMKHEDVLSVMCHNLGGDIIFSIDSDGTVGAMDFMMSVFEFNYVTRDLVKSIKSAKFCFNRMSSLQLTHAAFLIENVLAGSNCIKCMDFRNCGDLSNVEMCKVLENIPHARQVGFSGSLLSRIPATKMAEGLARVHDIKISELFLNGCCLIDDVFELLCPFIPLIEHVNLQGNPRLTDGAYRMIHESVISIKKSERRLKTLWVDVGVKSLVNGIFKGMKTEIKTKS